MEKLNREFYDEYTRLDNLCRQMFNSDKGVSGYIEAMKSTPYSKSSKIKDWDSDLKMLRQYRHIRNYLAHTTGAFHQDVCLPYDVTWIQNFYSKIMKRRDPLAMLFKMAKGKGTEKSKSSAKKRGKRKSNSKVAVLIFCIAALLGVLLFLLIKM